jgi:hypothetical protein
MPVSVELVRSEWEDGHRRLLDEARGVTDSETLFAQVEAVTEELRKRIGETFTLAQLADLYAGADGWSRDAVAERVPVSGWPRTASLAADAAFHLYARNAVDYLP